MSIPSQSAALCCRRATSTGRSSLQCLRSYSSPACLLSSQSRQRTSTKRTPTGRRWQSTEAPATSPESTNPKITSIVDQISQLTLLETADLVSTLKTRLNIPDIPMGFAAAAGGAAGGVAAPAPVEEEDEAPAAAPEKTLFNLTLKSFDAAAKPKIIKEVKNMLGLSLVDSKKFVESAPKLMKESVPKEEAEKIVEVLKGLGGEAVME